MFADITDQAIDAADLLERVADPDHGAALLFLGIVRQVNEGRRVTGMEYDAYREMASGVLSEILRESTELCPDASLAAVHRVGALEVGEVSVAIAVSTGHRAEAYDVSRYIIEEIKKRLPVWKREAYVEGDREWLPGHIPEVGATHE